MRLALPLVAVLALVRAPAQESVQFQADDGQPLAAALTRTPGTARGGVLLVHGFQSNRLAWNPLVPPLAAAGLHVLALDLRGHGASRAGPDGRSVALPAALKGPEGAAIASAFRRDVAAGVAFLVAAGAPADRIAVVGAGTGAAAALEAAAATPDAIAAAVLLTPESDAVGDPAAGIASKLSRLPVLVLTSDEDAGRGPQAVAAALGECATLKTVPGTNVPGTRLLGRYGTVEAAIVEWLVQNLARARPLEIPFLKTVIVDGTLRDAEAPGAAIVDVPLDKRGNARLRLSRNRTRLIAGFDVPERCVRQNEVVVFAMRGEGVADLPTPECWRISYCPNDPGRPAVLVQRGDGSRWVDAEARAVAAHADTTARDRWTAEVAIDLDLFADPSGRSPARLGFQINGAVAGQESFHPPTANVKLAPRAWAEAFLAAPSP